MKAILSTLIISAALAMGANADVHSDHSTTTAPAAVSAAQASTQAALRDLWVEHVFWVRNYVLASKTKDAAQIKAATAQVLANATSISGAVAAYYGKPAGEKMLTLLAGHWGAVKAYSDATFSKNAKGQEDASAQLVTNAKAIAAFLASANPNLPEATLVRLLSAHGAHHFAQAQQIYKSDYEAEAKTWAGMRSHMITIADALASAIAKQFPEKF